MKLEALERIIADDKNGLFSMLALLSGIGIFINSEIVLSFFLGALLSSTYLVINSIFLGQLFFREESTNFRVAFGLLLLFMLLAVISGLSMLVVALEIFPILFKIEMVVAILLITTIGISLANHIQMRTVAKSRKKDSN